MVTLTIDGRTVQAQEGATILEAAAQADIHIPHLCYLKGINEIAACRVCCVEVEGERAMVTACNNPVKEGMVVHTNSPRVRTTRRINVELILSQHDCKCATCVRSGNCQLQTIANDLGIVKVHYETQLPRGLRGAWTTTFPLYHDYKKCIKCMRCIQVCDKVQTLSIWDVSGTGGRTMIDVSGNRVMKDSDCALCGQCITHCPTGGLRERDDTMEVFSALADPDKITVVQVAPAVRTAWGEAFGLPREQATMERMAAALRRLGFDYVFDTNFTADLTIMEEGSEFVERFTHRDQYTWPMFTSCCPGWVRFVKTQFPAYVSHLSTAKSPQQMFGAVAKSYFAQKLGVDPHDIFVVSIMPCTAKKSEAALPTMRDACGDADVDVVLTTREIVRMFRGEQINPAVLDETPFDSPLGSGTGAAVIFGATGGVMDAALRSAYYLVTGKNPDPDAFRDIRGMDGWKEAKFEIPGAGVVSVAVASGLLNTRKLMTALERGEVRYDFVEIMACPGGCAGGGGQPIHDGVELAEKRGSVLWSIDKAAPCRFSHENPDVRELYRDYLKKPLSDVSHHLLHTDHQAWKMPSQK